MLWLIRNQLGRRNLTPDQASYLRGMEYRLTKGPQGGARPKGNSCTLENTAEVLADRHGVSPRTIKNDAKFADAMDVLEEAAPGLREKVMRGQGPTKKAIVDAGKEDKESKPKKRLAPGERAFHGVLTGTRCTVQSRTTALSYCHP